MRLRTSELLTLLAGVVVLLPLTTAADEQRIHGLVVVTPPPTLTDLLQRNGPPEVPRNETRTDLAPRPQSKSKVGNYECPPTQGEVQMYDRVHDLQNSDGRIPILQPILNAAALRATNEKWQARCDGNREGEQIQRQNVISAYRETKQKKETLPYPYNLGR